MTGRKIRVAVLFGGQSGEHDVSLRSAQTIMDSLDPEKYEVVPVGITREGAWIASGDPLAALAAQSSMPGLAESVGAAGALVEQESSPSPPASLSSSVDVVFPALHGPMGEDGTIQGMLELSGTAYIGSGVLGSAVAMDKAITKIILAQHGIPQAPWLAVTRSELRKDADAVMKRIADELGYPCFIKPANLGSSVGISKVHDETELLSALHVAAHYDRRIVVEQGVNAREIEISVLGNEEPVVSVAGEVKPGDEWYDYDAKYVHDTSELIVPADLEPEILAEIQRIAAEAFKALDLAGLARVDFFLERGTNAIYLNEVNTIPGFTSISMYPMLWEASGIPLPQLVDRLIELAMERHAERRPSGA